MSIEVYKNGEKVELSIALTAIYQEAEYSGVDPEEVQGISQRMLMAETVGDTDEAQDAASMLESVCDYIYEFIID